MTRDNVITTIGGGFKRMCDPYELDPKAPQFPIVDRDKVCHTIPMVANINHIYLMDEIVDPYEYLLMIKSFNTASEQDQFVIHINCWGGDVYTAIELVHAIMTSRATTSCSIEGACASAATMIALACNSWVVNTFACFMVHSMTLGNFGKLNEVNASQDFNRKWSKKLFEKTYEGFMTPEEIEKCLEGKDYWFDSEETLARLNNVIALRKAQEEAYRKGEDPSKVTIEEKAPEKPKPKKERAPRSKTREQKIQEAKEQGNEEKSKK